MPDIAGSIQEFLRTATLIAVPALLALTLHEVAHGLAALWMGDSTAKDAGRLTLNPLKHLDLVGTIAIFIVRIGWAKPVPVNPSRFKNPAKGMLLVSAAGPAMNFLLAVAFAALLGALALLPVPAEGTVQHQAMGPLVNMVAMGVIINLALGFFNLLPVPPLDGANILAGLLPPSAGAAFMRMGRWGFLLVIVLAFTGVLGKVLWPMVDASRTLLFDIFL
jgi:Zn-dependent protease